MKRRYDVLLPFEERILDALGDRELYGLQIAAALGLGRQYGGFSTLYRALHRLAGPKMNQLDTRLESARNAERGKRPRRRLYRRRQRPASTSQEPNRE